MQSTVAARVGIAERIDATLPRIHSLYGLVYATIGELPKAEASFSRALELGPNDSEARQNWGWYLCTHGRAKESIAEFEVAIRDPLYREIADHIIETDGCSPRTVAQRLVRELQ